jgi:hypothetical protein
VSPSSEILRILRPPDLASDVGESEAKSGGRSFHRILKLGDTASPSPPDLASESFS